MIFMSSKNLRKIIPQGYSRLIAIPLFWLNLVGIESGEYVEFSLGKHHELILKPRKLKQ